MGGGLLRRAGRRARARRHRAAPRSQHLGPDLTRADVTDADIDACVERMDALAEPTDEIGAVLLDQRVACGVGNVYKSEVLWACGVDPFANVGRARPHRSAAACSTPRPTHAAAPTWRRRVLAPPSRPPAARRIAVYGRRGRAVPALRHPIRMRRQGEQARSTYWCPTCQPARDAVAPGRLSRETEGRDHRRRLRRARRRPRPRRAPVDVTLVDRNNFHTFLPLLYQVATAGLNAADVAHAVRGIVRDHANVAFRQASVTGVDWAPAASLLDDGDPLAVRPPRRRRRRHREVLRHPRRRRARPPALHARPTPSPCATTSSAASRPPTPTRRSLDDGALTFVVVGGGATGVEVAGALAELFAVVLRRDFPRLDVGKARIVLVEMGDDLLPAFRPQPRATPAPRSSAAASRCAPARPSPEVTPTARALTSRRGAARPHPGLGRRRAGQPGGRRPRRRDRPGRAHRGRSRPPHPGPPDGLRHRRHRRRSTTATAVCFPASPRWRSSRVATSPARSDDRSTAPRPKPFHYTDKGSMATIGRRAAVAEIPSPAVATSASRARPAGWPGSACTSSTCGFRNRVSVLLNWAWNYLTWDRGPRLIFGQEPNRSPGEGEGEV